MKLDVQARFEQVEASPYGPVAATQLTSFAAKDNISATVEIRYFDTRITVSKGT